jgi:hypothetical protein
MQLVFRPEAQRELQEAQDWYEERSPGLGFEFARAVDAAVARVLRIPGFGSVCWMGCCCSPSEINRTEGKKWTTTNAG